MTPQQLIDSLPAYEGFSSDTHHGWVPVQSVLDVLKVKRVDVLVSSPLMGLLEAPRTAVLDRLQRWYDNFPQAKISQHGAAQASIAIRKTIRGKRVRYSLQIHTVGVIAADGGIWTNL